MGLTRILLVDDDEALTSSLGRYLAGTGRFRVRTENEGARAVPAARDFQPDVILLDLVMPDLEGSEVAARLESSPDLADIPVIFLTGLVSVEEIGPGKEIGGHPFIPKPVEPAWLVEQIERLLGASPQ